MSQHLQDGLAQNVAKTENDSPTFIVFVVLNDTSLQLTQCFLKWWCAVVLLSLYVRECAKVCETKFKQ